MLLKVGEEGVWLFEQSLSMRWKIPIKLGIVHAMVDIIENNCVCLLCLCLSPMIVVDKLVIALASHSVLASLIILLEKMLV